MSFKILNLIANFQCYINMIFKKPHIFIIVYLKNIFINREDLDQNYVNTF